MKIPTVARFQIKPVVAFNWLESVTDWNQTIKPLLQND